MTWPENQARVQLRLRRKFQVTIDPSTSEETDHRYFTSFTLFLIGFLGEGRLIVKYHCV